MRAAPHPAGLLPAMLMLLLAGCAVPPQGVKPGLPDDAQTLWRQHREKMSGILSWRLKGKMSVKTGHKGGSATLLWDYRQDRREIELYGPFGSGRVQISAQPGRAVLKDTEGSTIEGASAAEVLYQRLGWRVPFQELQYWVRGIPGETAATDLTLDAAGRLKTLRQGNWRVEYFDYNTVGQIELPRKLAVTAVPGTLEVYDRDGAYIGDRLRVTVILKRWWDIRFAE